MNPKQGLRIVCVVWAARLVVAWVVSRPLSMLLTAGVSDDRLLFEPGAFDLLEVLRLRFDLLGPALQTTLGLALIGYAALTCVSVWATRAIASASALPGRVEPVALPRLLGRVTALALAVLGPLAVLAAVGLVVLGALHGGPLTRATPTLRDLALLGGLALLAALLALLGVVHDLSRAHVVVRDGAVLVALRRALQQLGGSFWRIVGARLLLAAATALVVGSAAAVTGAISVDRPGALRAWAALLTHQLAAWLLAALHVAWLWFTLRPGSETNAQA